MSFRKPVPYPYLTVNPYDPLLSGEKQWQKRCTFLKQCGYQLRPRYRPDWVPSWQGSSKALEEHEDSIVLSPNYCIMDAIQLGPGENQPVAMKSVPGKSTEYLIVRSFNELSHNRTNRCVPILRELDDPVKLGNKILVMPYLRPFNKPGLKTVGDAIDFVEQMLEGLTYMHESGVVHRNLCARNIMMDARAMYPNGHHPVKIDCAVDGRTPIEPDGLRHKREPVVQYYFIDFERAMISEPGQRHFILGTQGNAPELSNSVPYDPFKADVFSLGTVFREHVPLRELSPVFTSMTMVKPEERSTAKQARNMLGEIRRGIDSEARGMQLTDKTEGAARRHTLE